MYTNMKTFLRALSFLQRDMEEVCKSCERNTCRKCHGLTWLLPDEATDLYEKGVELLEINEELRFLNPYPGKMQLEMNLDDPKVHCPHSRGKKDCALGSDRPLLCRMYPFDFIIQGEYMYLIIYRQRNCPIFNASIDDDNDFLCGKDFLNRAIHLFQGLSPELKDIIRTEYEKVHAIYTYPGIPNSCLYDYMNLCIIYDYKRREYDVL
jgi:Fe-S-cluster containining protein